MELLGLIIPLCCLILSISLSLMIYNLPGYSNRTCYKVSKMYMFNEWSQEWNILNFEQGYSYFEQGYLKVSFIKIVDGDAQIYFKWVDKVKSQKKQKHIIKKQAKKNKKYAEKTTFEKYIKNYYIFLDKNKK